MKVIVRRAGLALLVLVMILSLAACGQQATNVTAPAEDTTKEVVVETAPPSPTPTPTPTPSVPPVAVTTVPMPMPSVTPTVSITTPEGDAATATATASPTVSPSPTPSATTGTARTEVYSADAAFASTINPDSTNVPAGATNGYIVGNDVNFRGGPSASARLLGTYDSGTRVRILGTENGWTEVIINGVTGYVSSQYVSYGTAGGGSSVIVSGSGNTMVIVPDGPASSSGAVIAPDDGDYFLGIKPD